MGRFMLALLASVAELEKNLCGERTSAALAHLKATGKVYGPVTFGHSRDGDCLREDEREMQTVTMIQEWRASGWSLPKIANELNGLGIPTKKNRRWYPSTVSYILKRLQAA